MDGKAKNFLGLGIEVLGFALLLTAIVAAVEKPFVMISIIAGAGLILIARLLRGTLKVDSTSF